MFPSLSAAEIYAATAERWDTSSPFPLPRPGWLACPVCRTPDPQPRWWQFHRRPETATVPYRCDVAFKCVSCAAVWLHGVALTRKAWVGRPDPSSKRAGIKYTWRDVQRLMGL